MLIRILTLLVFITPVSPSPLPPCTFREKVTALLNCSPKIDKLTFLEIDYIGKPKNSTFYHSMNSICDEAMKCYEPLKCKEALTYRVDVDQKCDFKIDKFPDNLECITNFFNDVHSAQYSRDSCLSRHDFLHSNLTTRRAAYLHGKECFLKYVRENCQEISVDYFSKRYEKFTEVLSSPPSVHSCSDEHHQLKHLQCHASLRETQKRIDNLQIFDTFFGSTRVNDAVKACQDTKMCIQGDDCFTSTAIPEELERICRKFE